MCNTVTSPICSMIKSTQLGRYKRILGVLALLLATVASHVTADPVPVTRAEATVLSVSGSAFQASVTAMTSDANLITTGWTNASYDVTNGMVVAVEPGTFSIGFGSYIPESYTGPGAIYLHRVRITDQNDNVLLEEPFDGWQQTAQEITDNVARTDFSSDAGVAWQAYSDSTDIYTGYGDPFEYIDSSGDKGIVYPLDGGGPFSVLARTIMTVPDGVTELRINIDWRYNVNMFGGEPRLFSIGLKRGIHAPENLFSFSAPATYTLTFNSDGGSAVDPITMDAGSPITAPTDPVRSGFTFAGWNPAIPATMPAEDTTLTAQWTVNQYSLSFNSAGGSAVNTIAADFGAAITAPATPTRTGFTFAGWSPTIPATMPAENLAVTAQWTVNQYSLNFDSAGGSAINSITTDFGAAITAPADPIRNGYTFSGWLPAIPATMPSEDLTIVAQYEPIMLTASVTLSGDGTVSPASQQISYGEAAVFTLTLTDPQDVVHISGDCPASISANQLTTAALTQNCAISLVVHPHLQVNKENSDALATNSPVAFSISGGSGSKELIQARLLRAGEEEELDLETARDLLTLQGEDGSYLFSASRTGRYTFRFEDNGSDEQIEASFDVMPYLAFTAGSQPIKEQGSANVTLWLSDEPISYPVTATLTLAGSSMTTNTVQLSAEDLRQRSYIVSVTNEPDANVSLSSAVINNALVGTPARHVLNIQEEAPPLAIAIIATQADVESYVIWTDRGVVSLGIEGLDDANAEYLWHSSDLTLDGTSNAIQLDPANLGSGRYLVSVSVSSGDGRSGEATLALRVVDSCPIADCQGSEISGIPNSENIVAATPNRLPICPAATTQNRVSSCENSGNSQLIAEVPNAYVLTLGALTETQSWEAGQYGLALNDLSLPDPGYTQFGLVTNFDIKGLGHPGEAVPVAIPLPQGVTIPANAVWRKYIDGQWQDFVVDDHNAIDSAMLDVLGSCPGVSSTRWSQGLAEGHGCVRLTIEDGGPNDDDGLKNGVIRDPGTLAVRSAVTDPDQAINVKSGGSFSQLLALLVAGLALLRQRKLWFAALLPFGLSAQTLYLGAEAISAHSDTSSAEITGAMADRGLSGSATVSNKDRSGFRIYTGYRVLDSLSLELGWLDLGDISTQFQDVPALTSASDLEAVWPASGEGVELSALWQPLTFGDWFTPGLRAGLWRMESEARYNSSNNQSTLLKSDENVPFVELQAELAVNEQWAVKAGVSHYELDVANIRTMQLGLIYRF